MARVWVYRTSDGLWLRDKGGEPLVTGEDVVTLLDGAQAPNPITERCDPLAPSRRRPATAPEITAARNDARNREIEELRVTEAVVRATYELKTNAWTLGQYFDRIKAIYRSLG